MHETRPSQDMHDPHDMQGRAPRTGASGADGTSGAVDVHLLAERVYRLMVAEVRLERARGHATTHTQSHTRR